VKKVHHRGYRFTSPQNEQLQNSWGMPISPQVMQDHPLLGSTGRFEKHAWHCKTKGGFDSVQVPQDHCFSSSAGGIGRVEWGTGGGGGFFFNVLLGGAPLGNELGPATRTPVLLLPNAFGKSVTRFLMPSLVAFAASSKMLTPL
jgi:hypothetical protein